MNEKTNARRNNDVDRIRCQRDRDRVRETEIDTKVEKGRERERRVQRVVSHSYLELSELVLCPY